MNACRFLVRSLALLLLLVAAPRSVAQVSGPGSTGKEFYFSFPTNYEDPTATQQYIRLYITAPYATTVRLYTGSTLKSTFTTVANGIVEKTLTKFEAQAVTRDTKSPIPNDAVYTNRAIRIVADEPVTVYGINRTSYTTDGMLAIPTNGLGERYIVATATDYITGGYFPDLLPSQFVITAPYDSTQVTITPSAKTAGHEAGASYTITLHEGDVYSSMTTEQRGDLSGTVIVATKPVAVTAGNNCAYLPNQNFPACDHIEEMLLPIESWGTVYHSIPFATRLKGDLYRIFAAEDDTEIWINGVKAFTLPGGNGGEGTNWVEYLPTTREPMLFTADKPIMVLQYNNSQSYDGVPSDPFYTVLTPVEQYQSSVTFATPSPGDFAQNYLTVVGDSATFGLIQVSSDGGASWGLLSERFPATRQLFTASGGTTRYAGMTTGIPAGVYRLRGSGFGGYLYGFSAYDSYGYPLGVSTSDIATPDSLPPIVGDTQDPTGRVIGTVVDIAQQGVAPTALASIDLEPGASVNYALTVSASFQPGVHAGVTYALTVIDPSKSARAVLVAYDRAGNVVYDTVSFAGVTAPVIEATDHDFGSVGTAAATEYGYLSVLNRSATHPLTITSFELVGDNAFEIVAVPIVPVTVAPGDTLGLIVLYDPVGEGAHRAELIVHSDAKGIDSVSVLTGRGVRQAMSATSYDFGIIDLDSETERQGFVRLENTGSAPITLTDVDTLLGDRDAFSLATDALSDMTLAPGESLDIVARFHPTRTGSHELTIHWGTTSGLVATSSLTGGATRTSGIETGESAGGLSVAITPNPVTGDRLLLDYTAGGSAVTVTMRAIDGTVVGRWERDAGQTRAEVALPSLAAGTYLVQLSTARATVLRRVVVIR